MKTVSIKEMQSPEYKRTIVNGLDWPEEKLMGKKYVNARKKAKRLVVSNHPKRPEIVSNIPIPTQTRGGTRKFDCFYPFEEMKVGDSFWVPSDTQCMAGAVSKFAKRTGWRFVTRGQSLDGRANREVGKKRERGTRVWRVK